MTIVAYPVGEIARKLGISADQVITGIKLSLDSTVVEVRVNPVEHPKDDSANYIQAIA